MRAMELFPEKQNQCQTNYLLGVLCHTKGGVEKAIHHSEVALGIASSSNRFNLLFCIHSYLAQLFSNQGKFDDAHAHIEHAKSHATNYDDTYRLTDATHL